MKYPVTTFPIMGKIYTILFIDRMAALYKVDGWIKIVVRVVITIDTGSG